MRRNRSYRLVRRHGGLIHQRNQTSALSGRSSRFLVLPPPQTCRPVGLLLLYSCAKVQINKNKTTNKNIGVFLEDGVYVHLWDGMGGQPVRDHNSTTKAMAIEEGQS